MRMMTFLMMGWTTGYKTRLTLRSSSLWTESSSSGIGVSLVSETTCMSGHTSILRIAILRDPPLKKRGRVSFKSLERTGSVFGLF